MCVLVADVCSSVCQLYFNTVTWSRSILHTNPPLSKIQHNRLETKDTTSVHARRVLVVLVFVLSVICYRALARASQRVA